MGDSDLSAEIAERVRDAAGNGSPLVIRGGGSKHFLGRGVQGETLEVAGHRGIVSHEPTELVLTARAGTPLALVEETLAAHAQMLPFEPPHLGEQATLGGTIACGLSGPRRPYAGAARDFVLGTRIVNGRGQRLRFGGEVMKNVAGYDVSRLMAGAMGTLGVLLEVSLKVLPCPATEVTLCFEMTHEAALARCNEWAARPLPLSATAYVDGVLRVRLSGTPKGVQHACEQLGGERADAAFWPRLREQQLDFFAGEAPLWRLAVPPTAAALELPGTQLLEWGGGLRWLRSDEPAAVVRGVALAAGGHATLFRHMAGADAAQPFQPLPAGLDRLHRRVKAAFDPHGILNPGRMYAHI